MKNHPRNPLSSLSLSRDDGNRRRRRRAVPSLRFSSFKSTPTARFSNLAGERVLGQPESLRFGLAVLPLLDPSAAVSALAFHSIGPVPRNLLATSDARAQAAGAGAVAQPPAPPRAKEARAGTVPNLASILAAAEPPPAAAQDPAHSGAGVGASAPATSSAARRGRRQPAPERGRQGGVQRPRPQLQQPQQPGGRAPPVRRRRDGAVVLGARARDAGAERAPVPQVRVRVWHRPPLLPVLRVHRRRRARGRQEGESGQEGSSNDRSATTVVPAFFDIY